MRFRPLGTPLSDAESARLASMEARAEEPEALRERVARAIAESDGEVWDTERTDWHGDYLLNADAAIATICTPVGDEP